MLSVNVALITRRGVAASLLPSAEREQEVVPLHRDGLHASRQLTEQLESRIRLQLRSLPPSIHPPRPPPPPLLRLPRHRRVQVLCPLRSTLSLKNKHEEGHVEPKEPSEVNASAKFQIWIFIFLTISFVSRTPCVSAKTEARCSRKEGRITTRPA